MKFANIAPVEKPKSFADVKFTQQEWEAAQKIGKKGLLTLPYGTAMENIRLSKGLYKIVQQTPDPSAQFKVQGMTLDDMNHAQLLLIASQLEVVVKKGDSRARVQEAVAKAIEEWAGEEGE